jgi:hypothetical protein
MRFSILFVFAILRCALAGAADLETWWHDNAELNDSSAVADDHVRRSTIYDVRVATQSAPEDLHSSFTYMSLPRSGRPKQGYSQNDGAEFSAQARMTLSWSSFLYRTDTWVYVDVKNGPDIGSADEVTIRPTRLGFQKELAGPRTIRILVPYSADGYRFSVEIKSDLLTSYREGGRLTTNGNGNPAVHTEPRNGLMIFAEPMPSDADVDRLVPSPASHSIYYPDQGQLTNLDQVSDEVVYFRPGTYYMGWNHHAYLPANVRWVYLAPGAYVKGAFQFRSAPSELKVTGFGVLSGEQYVYEPDRANGYQHRSDAVTSCHGSCVKMLELYAGPEPEHLTLHGITVANPPYHSFVVYGDTSHFTMDASHGKQLGGWYWQTDGLELYEGSSMAHMFYHSNDDVLKLYSSHARASDVVVWKLENGPVIQWGWMPRNIDDVHVNGLDVIHNRMYLDSQNSCIISSARSYLDPSSPRLANPSQRVSHVVLENIRSEGMNLCAMRLFALSSWESITIRNLWIERWSELDSETQASRFEALWSPAGARVSIGNEVRDHNGLSIESYMVGGEHITKGADNWRSSAPGRLNFDASLWDDWDAR